MRWPLWAARSTSEPMAVSEPGSWPQTQTPPPRDWTEDQERALHAIGQHLEEGGRLVFNTYDPLGDIAREGLASPMRKDLDFFDERTGRAVAVYYSRQVDPQVQIIEQELLFEEFDEEGVSLGRWLSVLQLRWTPQGEMAHLLERCGFQVDALYGDFEGAPYPGYGEQVWVASRA